MKLTKQLFGIALTAITAGAFVACTNELSDPRFNNNSGALKLVRTPEVYAWSGNQTLNSSNLSDVYTVPTPASTGSTRATRDGVTRDFGSGMFTVTEETVEWPYDVKKGWGNGQYTNPNDAGPAGLINYLNYTAGVIGTYSKVKENLIINYMLESIVGTDFTFYPYVTSQTNQANKEVGLFYYDAQGERHEQIIWVVGDDDAYKDGYITGLHITFSQPCKFGLYFSGRTRGNYTTEDDTYYYTLPSINAENEPDMCIKEHTGIVPSDKYPPEFTKGLVMFVEDYDEGSEDAHDFDDFALIMIGNNLPTVKDNPSDDDIKNEDIPGSPGDDGDDDDDNCDICGHPDHNRENGGACEKCDGDDPQGCEKPKVSDPKCPKHDDTNPGCGHDIQHNEDGTCPKCKENDQHSVCDPCPKAGEEADEDGCGHAGHLHDSTTGHCSKCEQEGTTSPCNPSTSTGGNTGTTKPDEVYKHDNEVEVNFEAVDSHENLGDIKDLATKLSIHVRHATDVDIKIPVPTRYIIDSDDLYIFNEHYGKFGDETAAGYHGSNEATTVTGDPLQYTEGRKQTLHYSIAGYNVYLHVEFMAGDEQLGEAFKDGYIHVWTEGITKDVIDWCFEHNGDGINFEIWTYYSTETANTLAHRAELKGYFDKSIIDFIINDPSTQSKPDYYINAFGYDYVEGTWGQTNKGIINPDDCYVTLIDSETFVTNQEYKHRDQMGAADKWDEHLNGTPYNQIYVNKNKQGGADHAHGGTN